MYKTTSILFTADVFTDEQEKGRNGFCNFFPRDTSEEKQRIIYFCVVFAQQWIHMNECFRAPGLSFSTTGFVIQTNYSSGVGVVFQDMFMLNLT